MKRFSQNTIWDFDASDADIRASLKVSVSPTQLFFDESRRHSVEGVACSIVAHTFLHESPKRCANAVFSWAETAVNKAVIWICL